MLNTGFQSGKMQCRLVLRYSNGEHEKGWRLGEGADISTYDVRKVCISKKTSQYLSDAKGAFYKIWLRFKDLKEF